ncbi:thiamine pyrophosphate-binding protein [Brevibacterium picturae]|uniref:2-succinyl-5-enolpyruvyl-6-hydroxy-3-cyclohexene-1-carboxylate synthase n=1 Tax=Brevibacterium picturae TaxID=260553 RepID=A0ABN2BB68_9MICO
MLNSSAVAQQIARGVASSGVTEVVIAPGSRSAPLIYALAPLAEAGVIRTHVRIDERDAGFLALGLARGLRAKQSAGADGGNAGDGGAGAAGSGAVALVTTSGSAVANLHPAVLEASYGHLPLIAITADRPARLRGTGANQTIDDQSQVLSDVRARFDVPAGSADAEDLIAEAVARSLGAGQDTLGLGDESGPVQFNVQFDVPLVPTVDELAQWKTDVQTLAAKSASTTGNAPAAERTVSVRILPGTVIVAGDAGGHSADSLSALAEEYATPVLAEPSSPLAFELRASHTLVPAHARVLADCESLRSAIRSVIVHGKPTLTRPVAALLADPEILIQRLPDDVDAVALSASADEGVETADAMAWRDEWVGVGEAVVADSRRDRRPLTATQPLPKQPLPKQTLARAITEYLAGSAINLFAASSNTIRYLSDANDIRAHIHASRGLAGIDGLISTATGISLALDEQVVLVIGDVAMLHDVGGLLNPSAEVQGEVLIVALNDDGGAIFSGLEHSQDHVAPYLERYFTVPHGRDFRDLANAYGWGYAEVSELDDFVAEFEAEFEKDRSDRQGTHRKIIEVDLA